MRRIALAAAAAAVLAACSGGAGQVAEQTPPPTVAASPVRAAEDPGVGACKASAKRQREAADSDPLPTLAERRASWERYQRSAYPSLREVGSKLERAWTAGDLADQIEAGMNLVISCAAYGVDVPVG